jgi:hypothetical protein
MTTWTSRVDEFGAIFITNLQRVNVAGTAGANKLPRRAIDEDAARRVGGNVNIPRLIDRSPAVARADRFATRGRLEMVWNILKIQFLRGGQ